MGVSMSTIVQWTVILAVVGAYFFITNKGAASPLAQKVIGGAKAKDLGFLEDTSGAEKKKKSSKKEKKQQKPAPAKELQVPKVTLESESNEEVPDNSTLRRLEEDKGSLQRLAGFKTGQNKSNKPEPKTDKKKADKTKQPPTTASVATPDTKLNATPVSPLLGAISSTSSTTGADGDIDEPDSVDEGNLIDDMLEATSEANVLRITPGKDEFTTVTRKKGNQQSEKKDGPTALQKKNQKKNEMKKELKKLEKEDQLRRLESHKKDQRLAREAEAAKTAKKAPPPPASSAWADIKSQDASSAVATGLLDTFDSSSSNKTSKVTPSSSDVSEDLRQAIPQEFLAEHYASQRELPQENEWVEVKKIRRDKKKPVNAESETDSDARFNASTPANGKTASAAAAVANNPQQAQPKPKKQFTEQDLRIPAMPTAENSDGWDAHAW